METMWYQSKKEIKEIKICSIKKISVRSKVIIHKSHGEVSLVEQDTIENVSAAYLKFIIILLRKNLNLFHLHFMQLFSADAKIYFFEF